MFQFLIERILASNKPPGHKGHQRACTARVVTSCFDRLAKITSVVKFVSKSVKRFRNHVDSRSISRSIAKKTAAFLTIFANTELIVNQ